MALAGPVGNDNMNISFRLHSKSQVFDGSSNSLANARLSVLASASSLGLVFVGSSAPELYVLCMKDLEAATSPESNTNAPVRKIPMPSPVTQLATNCDGSILAVDVKINGVPHIQLFSVASFLNPNVQKLREFRVSADNASSAQLCWNPVINSALAVCTENGMLALYLLKDQGVEFHSIDPSLKAKCCCWSPKGKQIVAGFGNGKLMQFNLELKPARTIECPPGVMGGSFDTIAIQWLATYQFAIALLSHAAAEARPVLHIVNAPKAGPLQYIAYGDVCYSTSEVRPSKIYLQYIQQWGILMVASANCIDVSFLRITKPGDIPEWTLEFPNDQFPGELPLTPEKDESFPIGFELDTACSGRLPQEDGSHLPVMPMIHMLSTYGVLCSFYFVNTTPSYVDICSPPRPIDPRVQMLFTVNTVAQMQKPQEEMKTPSKPILPTPIGHSTPAAAAPSMPKTNLFGGFGSISAGALAPTTTSAPQINPANAFAGFSLPTNTLQQQQQMPNSLTQSQPPPPSQQLQQQPITFKSQPSNVTAPTTTTTASITSNNQPLITIPPTYNPPAAQAKMDPKEASANAEKLSDKEDEQVYVKMIHDEMKAFELELNFLMEKSRTLKVNIGTKEESAEMRRQLEELDELKKEATETVDSLRSDVQTNRLVLTELFSMVYEAKSKCDQANDEKSLIMTPTQDRTSKRALEKLKKMISQCDIQVQVAVQLLSSQWANYQETVSKNRKSKMHIPSLEGVYQTLTKQQEIIYNLNGKLKMLKSKLGIFDDVKKQKGMNATIESLSDSIISMSLMDQVQNEKSKLSDKKLKNLRNYLEGRGVVTIKPQRPQLPGLNSEIIIEKKIKAMKTLKKPEVKKQQPEPKAPAPTVVQNVPASIQAAAKPPPPSESVFNLSQKASPFTALPASNSPAQLSFGKKPEEPSSKPSFGFGQATQQPFALNLSGSTTTSLPQPNFGFSSTVSAEQKKKEEISGISKTLPKTTEVKPPSTTIGNANVSVSANFSLSLPSKTSAAAVAAKETEKKVEQPKPSAAPPTTNETTSFTFSLPGKKEASASKPTAQATAISFGSSASNTASETVKNAFSFGTNQPSSTPSFGFGNVGKGSDAKTPATSVFGGTTSAPFSGFSLSLGGADSNKPAGPPMSFVSALTATKPVEEVKPISSAADSTSAPISATATSTTSSSGFSFGSLSTPPLSSSSSTGEVKSSTSFSFANFDTSLSTASPAVSTALQSPAAPQAPSIFGTKTAPTPVSSSSASATDSVLSGLKICSPEVSKPPETQTTPPASIFGGSNAPKSDSSSIFGGNAFGAAFGSAIAKSPILPTPPTSEISSSPPTSTVTTTTQSSTPSIFGTSTATSPSIFGSLSINASKTQTPTTATTAASSNIFASSLVKPDQSVFGQPAATTSSSSFGNIFGSAPAAAAATSALGTSTTATTTASATSFGSIFGGSTQASNTSNIFGAAASPASPSTNIFAQANQATQQQSATSGGSIFGQTAATATGANTSGSLFSQSSFASPSTGSSIFGGGSTTTQSPFGGGSSNIFGSTGQQQQQSSAQSTSIFGGGSSNAFGAQPSSNIFGGSTSPSTTQSTSPFGGGANIFAQQNTQQSPNQPVFGGNATFSNTFGQSTFGSSSIFGQQQQQQSAQPVFGGGATFGSPKANIFGATPSSPPQQSVGQANIFEQLGSQQSGNLFGNLAPQQQPPQQSGFSGSAFSSWR